MKKHIITAIAIAIMAGVFNTGCNEDSNNSSPTSTMRTSQFAGVQGNCTSGGVKIEVLVDGVVDDAQTQYLCNGANGQNGQNGQGGQSGSNTTLRTTPFTDAQGGCANGGIKFEVLVDGVVDDTQTQYICNGANGQGGQSGSNTTMRTTPFTDAQGGCTNGGVKIEVLVDGVVDDAQTQYICNGAGGQSGTNTTMRSTPFEGALGSCSNGGVKIEFLVNGVVDDAQTQYICNGAQGETGCTDGQKYCEGACTDITASTAHCGACGHNCNSSKPSHATTMTCVESQCAIAACEDGYIPKDSQCVSCSDVAGWSKCNGKCVQTDIDNMNCGTCGNKCGDSLICANGKCVGNTTCSGVAVNTGSSLDHCGNCNNRCDDGKTCINGKCVTGYGQAYCGGDKVQIGNVDRCGGCNDKCADGKICKDNKCVDGAGPTYCNGSTTNTLNDVSNCGACGHRCENSICINGECVDSQGSYSTDEMYCNGTIIHYLSDSAHCNGCGNTCAVGFQCVAGTCQPNPNALYKTTLTCNGIKVEPYYDSANCGQCGHVCRSGTCRAGACTSYCYGYSVDLMEDSANCGACGNRCSKGMRCVMGACQPYTLESYSTLTCNDKSVYPYSDSDNCGQCGNSCGSYECRYGECMKSCGGVTVSLMDDSANCGHCGNICGMGKICSSASCITGTGSTYCNGISVNTSSDDLNCGKCSNTCSGDYGCISGTCGQKYITFGHYEQDNNTSNGKEPIRWLILDKNSSGQYLVVSEKVLDVKPYNTRIISITWEKSTIRSWLNGYDASYNTVGIDFTGNNFIDTAFAPEEKSKIVSSSVPDHANPSFSTSPGNATTDKIFVLSITEANNYFATNAKRQADATRYAVKQGVNVRGSESYTTSHDGTCTDVHCYADWWLRSPGDSTRFAAHVSTDGSVDYGGNVVNIVNYGVRPALWVQY